MNCAARYFVTGTNNTKPTYIMKYGQIPFRFPCILKISGNQLEARVSIQSIFDNASDICGSITGGLSWCLMGPILITLQYIGYVSKQNYPPHMSAILDNKPCSRQYG